jgi:hypothetical protein
MDDCPFCGRRCHVPVSRQMPDIVRWKYEEAGWQFMSTCEAGILAEHARLGASYADVINERLGRAGQQTCTVGTRQLLEEMRASCERSRAEALKLKVKTDAKTPAKDVRGDAPKLREKKSRGGK